MSGQESESMSEKELAEWFQGGMRSDEPRSVGEALAAADAATEPGEELPEAPDEPTPVGEPPVVVEDEPTPPVQPPAEDVQPPAEVEAPEAEGEELEEEGEDPNVVWAKKRYGEDTAKWAKVAHDQEQHISRLASEKKEAEELAGQWYEYAQQVEQQAQSQTAMGMPLSSAEENWIEQSVSNPYQYARQAAMQGNVQLYQAVLGRVAEDNPMLAGQIGAQIQTEVAQLAAQENGQQQPLPTLAESLTDSISRLGIDLRTYGEPMAAKVGELGEFHPYVQTIMEGDPNARDMALLAVYDLVRATSMTTRKVRSEERDAQIKHEAELRKQASGVVTGGPVPEQPPQQSPFMDAMEREWRQRGQWTEE